MKKCKYCQTEIDSKAKVCPNCKRKISGMPTLVKVLLIIFIIILIIIMMMSACAKGVSDAIDESFADNKDLSYTISSQYSDDYGVSYYIEGSVTNNGSKDFSYLQIEFVCYDASGNNLGTALDNTNHLLANETWKYKAIFMGSDAKEISHCNYHEISGW